MGTIFSASLFFHLCAKVIFNLIADVKMPIDPWTIVDVISSCFNIVCFNVIGGITPDQVIDSAAKERLDFYVIAVVLVSWLRFFSYFLVIRNISKLMMTLVQMLYDTLSFIFLVICYMTVATTIFSTLFGNANPEQFGFIVISARTLYDAFIG